MRRSPLNLKRQASKIRKQDHIPWQQYLINIYWQVIDYMEMYGYTTWTLTKCIAKKLEGNNTRILYAVLNKSRKQQSIKSAAVRPLTSHLTNHPRKMKRCTVHCWKIKDELISDVLHWTWSVGWPAKTCISFVWTLDIVWRTYQERKMKRTDSER